VKAKRCPLCKGVPKYVYYAIPESQNPGGWDLDEDEVSRPIILLKRLECQSCGATVPQLVMSCDDAVAFWNGSMSKQRPVLQRISEEECRDVEEQEDPT
jgi:hypothetical protein